MNVFNNDEKLKSNLFYKNFKTKNLVVKNKLREFKSILKSSHIIYKI